VVLVVVPGDGVGLGIGFDLHVFGRVVSVHRVDFGTVVIDVLAALLRAAVHLHPVGLVHGARRHDGGRHADGCRKRSG